MARFRAIGGQQVPAVAKAGSSIPGGDLESVAEFLDLAAKRQCALPAEVLIGRLQHVLRTAIRLTKQLSVEHLADKLPNRDRTLLALANHIVEIAAGYLLVENGQAFDHAVEGAVPVRELDRDALATRSRSVCARLAGLQLAPEREVEATFGTSNRHRVLERCTWHAAQHTRQLAFMLERFGLEPDQPLSAADLAGLPLPVAVWDDESA